MILPKPECVSGYPIRQLEDILGDKFEEFMSWMRGQTMSLCKGKIYNHEIEEYEVTCNGVSHGPVVYRADLKRFLNKEPIID